LFLSLKHFFFLGTTKFGRTLPLIAPVATGLFQYVVLFSFCFNHIALATKREFPLVLAQTNEVSSEHAGEILNE